MIDKSGSGSAAPRLVDFPSFAHALTVELGLPVDAGSLERDSLLVDDMSIDSLGLVEILAFLYDRGADCDDEELARKTTLGEVYDLYALHAATPPRY